MPASIDFRFVQSAAGQVPNSQHDSQRTQLRSHASRMGYRNARNDRGRRPQTASTNVVSLSLAGQLNLSCLQSKFRVTVRQKSSPGSRFIHETGKDTVKDPKAISKSRSSSPDLTVPEPCPLISAEVNCPRYLYIWSQKLFPNESTFHRCFNVRDIQAIDHVRPYLEHEVFQTTMTAVSYAIYNTLGPGHRSISQHDIYTLRGEAITMLRQSIADSNLNGAVVLSILYLVLLEMLLREYKASDVHRSVLRQFVTQQGLDAMDEHVACCILQQNQYWLDAGMQPLLPDSSPAMTLQYPPFPLPSSLQWQVDWLPQGFRQLANIGAIATSNLCVLFRIYNVQLDLQKDTMHTRLNTYPLNGNSDYRTLLDACPVLKMPDGDDTIFQKILCWTLLIYSMVYLGNANAVSPLPLSARQDLTNSLFKLPQQQILVMEECVLWMWHIAVRSWRRRNGQLEGAGEALEQAQNQRFMHWYSNGRAEQVLESFSWGLHPLPNKGNTDLLKQLDIAQEIIDLRPDKNQ